MAVTTTDAPRARAVGTDARTEKGASLARGPALILGTILLVAGLYFLYKEHTFPRFSNFPNGDAPVQGKVFFGIFGVNGWTGMFTAAAGGLLLFGAAEHALAKAMSLIVGCCLGAAAIISLVSGNVLGMAAANHWTEVLWGASAVILLFNTLAPRTHRTVVTQQGAVAEPGAGTRRRGWRRHRAQTAAAGAVAGAEAERIHQRHKQERREGDAIDERGVGEPVDESGGSEARTAVADRAETERE
jgi:hypothetical protein